MTRQGSRQMWWKRRSYAAARSLSTAELALAAESCGVPGAA